MSASLSERSEQCMRSERQRAIKQSAMREQLGLRGFAGEGHDQPGHKRQEGSQPER
jgi:hypothetical protein